MTYSEDLRARGLVHQVTDEALYGQLDHGHLTGYVGFDPTGTSLHIGSLVPLCQLRRLQRAGHRPIALAGGGTGRIGDPGGKTEERLLLDDEQLAANMAGIRPQLERFIDFSPGPNQALVLDNDAWLSSMPLIEFLRDVGKHVTVNQMVAKESVKSRLERPDQGISFTEFSYMLLQGYDFLRLHLDHGCTLQMGGSDQWGNITVGIDLIRRHNGATAYGLTSPLVTKADGTKYGKSEAGAIWLDPAMTSPYRLYQYFFNTDDADVATFLRFFSFRDLEEIIELETDSAARPAERLAQRALAYEVCALVHGESETDRAVTASAALFSESLAELDESMLLQIVDDVPTTTLSRQALHDGHGLDLVDLLAQVGLVKSKTEARRALEQGGVYLNNRRVSVDSATVSPDLLLHDRYVLVRRGRREQHLLTFG